MRSLASRLRRELSTLELIISVIVILVLVAVLIHKALALLAHAEQAQMTATLNRARSSITLEALTRFVARDLTGIAALEGGNPIQAMETPPRNYIGELRSPEPEAIDGGVWYFDADARELVYRVKHEGRFHTLLPGPKRARFQVRLLYEDVNGDGSFDPHVDRFGGVTLAPVEPYGWRSKGRAPARR